MKNHELLELIGDVNEDYVLEAGDNVVKPRFGWRKLAVCAACGLLVLGAYPMYRMSQSQEPSGLLPLHDYTIVEGGALTTQGEEKVPARGTDASAPSGEDSGQEGIDGIGYDVPGQDAPVQEKAAAQYDALIKNGGVLAAEPDLDWYGGAWIDNSYSPEAKLAVAIVDGLRTPELEAQIEEWCGGEVVFQDVNYSWSHLDQLMASVSEVLDGTGLFCGIGVDVMENCLGVDLYSDGKDIPKEVLVKLGQLDPKGDAIRVRVFAGKLDTLTDEAVKGPAANSEPDAYAPVPGGVTHPTAEEGEQMKEEDRAAVYDLPQGKDDVIAEGE